MNFSLSRPIVQILPLPGEAYAANAMDAMGMVDGIEAIAHDDWDDYRATIGPKDRRARYAIKARRRWKAACPFASV